MAPPIVRFATAYGAGVWLGLVVPSIVSFVSIAGVGLVAALARRRWPRLLVATGVVGILVGAVRGAGEAAACAHRWDRGRQVALVQFVDAPRRGVAEVRVVASEVGCRGALRIRTDSTGVRTGATAVVVGTYRGWGVFRAGHVRVLRGWPVRVRDRIRGVVARRIERLYGSRAPIVHALVLGTRTDLDPRLRERFAAGGLAHLLAISGLHVGIIAGWIRLVARWWVRPGTAWVVSAAVTWTYVALLGFPAPAVRAATFVGLYAIGRRRQRRPLPEAVIAVGGLTILMVDPRAAVSVGAWLSVAAVVGTVVVRRWIPASYRRHPMVGLVAASVGATLATAPITAYAFGSVAPVGVVSNLAGVPLAGVVVPGVFSSLFFGGVLASGAGVGLAALERIAEAASAIPWGHLQGEAGWRFASPWIGLTVVVGWIRWRRPRWSRVRRQALGVTAVGTWIWAAAPVGAVLRGGTDLTIHLLSVGQGDAIAIRTPGGRWVLVDGGPRFGGYDAGRRVVLPFLRRRGVDRLDAVIVSHGDADHLGGMPAVIDRLRPRLVGDPGQPLGTDLYLEYLRAVDESGAEWRALRTGDTIMIDSVSLAVLHPSAAWMRGSLAPNENSVVVHLRYRNLDVLLTGDIGEPVETRLGGAISRVDILKVGHHGSAGSTTGRWLDAARPVAAVVSVGAGNRYGHPAPSVLERLRARGVPLFRTDRGGTVTIRSDGSYFQVEQRPDLSWPERIRCAFPTWSPSTDSSSSKSVCFRKPPGNSRVFSTTLP